MKRLKITFVLHLAISLFSIQAFAGSEGRGGGDLCEDRVKIVRDDIKDWITKGGANGLSLSASLSVEDYSKRMLSQIQVAKIKCVGSGDSGYPVQIDGTPKVCRFDKTNGLSQITCDFDKFQKMTESDQYVLIHHEYAGLTDIERPNGDSSNYEVSNQITDYLEDQVIKKLAVNPSSKLPAVADNGYRVSLSAYDIYMLLTQEKESFINAQSCDYTVSYNEKQKTVTISLTSSKSSSDSVTIGELRQSASVSSGPSGDNLRVTSLGYSTLARVTGNTVGSTGLLVSVWVNPSFQLTGIGFKDAKLVDDYNVQKQMHSIYWSTTDDSINSLGGISCLRSE